MAVAERLLSIEVAYALPQRQTLLADMQAVLS